MQPSVSSRSKVTAVADRSAASSCASVRLASVVSTHSMVASPGASIPAPLAIPPTEYPSTRRKAILTTVSVVLIASAAARQPPAREASATAASTLGGGGGGGACLSAAARGSGRSSRPRSPRPDRLWHCLGQVLGGGVGVLEPERPVQALAPPESSTKACTRPPATTWRVQVTGAACKLVYEQLGP